MKQQIKRLSPHQNGKVFGVIFAVASLLFVIPMALTFSAMPGANTGMPGWLLLAFPVIYLVMGYLSVAIGCLVYNVAFAFLGGIEFETVEVHD